MSKKIGFISLGAVIHLWYLGQLISHDHLNKVIRISQSDLICDLLDNWGMKDCKPASIPLSHYLHISPPCSPNTCSDIPEQDITILYQHLVGSITYLAICTCPDLAYAVMSLGPYNASPTCSHLVAAKGVLWYLAGIIDLCLVFSPNNQSFWLSVQSHIHACSLSDADWASDKKDHRSVSEYCFYYFQSLVFWSAWKQQTISTSSTESEYYAFSNMIKVLNE
jgi:hypothetical protein